MISFQIRQDVVTNYIKLLCAETEQISQDYFSVAMLKGYTSDEAALSMPLDATDCLSGASIITMTLIKLTGQSLEIQQNKPAIPLIPPTFLMALADGKKGLASIKMVMFSQQYYHLIMAFLLYIHACSFGLIACNVMLSLTLP